MRILRRLGLILAMLTPTTVCAQECASVDTALTSVDPADLVGPEKVARKAASEDPACAQRAYEVAATLMIQRAGPYPQLVLGGTAIPPDRVGVLERADGLLRDAQSIRATGSIMRKRATIAQVLLGWNGVGLRTTTVGSDLESSRSIEAVAEAWRLALWVARSERSWEPMPNDEVNASGVGATRFALAQLAQEESPDGAAWSSLVLLAMQGTEALEPDDAHFARSFVDPDNVTAADQADHDERRAWVELALDLPATPSPEGRARSTLLLTRFDIWIRNDPQPYDAVEAIPGDKYVSAIARPSNAALDAEIVRLVEHIQLNDPSVVVTAAERRAVYLSAANWWLSPRAFQSGEDWGAKLAAFDAFLRASYEPASAARAGLDLRFVGAQLARALRQVTLTEAVDAPVADERTQVIAARLAAVDSFVGTAPLDDLALEWIDKRLPNDAALRERLAASVQKRALGELRTQSPDLSGVLGAMSRYTLASDHLTSLQRPRGGGDSFDEDVFIEVAATRFLRGGDLRGVALTKQGCVDLEALARLLGARGMTTPTGKDLLKALEVGVDARGDCVTPVEPPVTARKVVYDMSRPDQMAVSVGEGIDGWLDGLLHLDYGSASSSTRLGARASARLVLDVLTPRSDADTLSKAAQVAGLVEGPAARDVFERLAADRGVPAARVPGSLDADVQPFTLLLAGSARPSGVVFRPEPFPTNPREDTRVAGSWMTYHLGLAMASDPSATRFSLLLPGGGSVVVAGQMQCPITSLARDTGALTVHNHIGGCEPRLPPEIP